MIGLSQSLRSRPTVRERAIGAILYQDEFDESFSFGNFFVKSFITYSYVTPSNKTRASFLVVESSSCRSICLGRIGARIQSGGGFQIMAASCFTGNSEGLQTRPPEKIQNARLNNNKDTIILKNSSFLPKSETGAAAPNGTYAPALDGFRSRSVHEPAGIA